MLRTLGTLVVLCTMASGTAHGQNLAKTQKNPSLPKVVLVGDSIRLSYARVVAAQLKGKAIVVSPKANGGDSRNVLKHLDQWVIDAKPDLVHINCGIHDTKKFIATGKYQISPTEYEANLRKIVARIHKKTGATVIFATTTPILDDRAADARQGRDYVLLGASVERYNDIARKVMAELKIPVNNLHAVLSKPVPPLTTEMLIGKDGVHLTNPARELLGKQVAATIASLLTRSPK